MNSRLWSIANHVCEPCIGLRAHVLITGATVGMLAGNLFPNCPSTIGTQNGHYIDIGALCQRSGVATPNNTFKVL